MLRRQRLRCQAERWRRWVVDSDRGHVSLRRRSAHASYGLERAGQREEGAPTFHAATAIDAHPTRNASPPSGVTAPSARTPVSVMT